MILGELEGNLSGFYSIILNKPIELGDYRTIFYFREDGVLKPFNPTFPIFEYEDKVEFTIDSDYVILWIRVEIIKPEVKPGDCYPAPYCDECAQMNVSWKKLT
jgi:hypothetical protein